MGYGLHVGGDPVPCACKHDAERVGDAGSNEADTIGVAPTLLLAAAVVVGAVAYRRHRAAEAGGKS